MLHGKARNPVPTQVLKRKMTRVGGGIRVGK